MTIKCKYSEEAECNEKDPERLKPVICLCCLTGGISENFVQIVTMLATCNVRLGLSEASFVLNSCKRFTAFQKAVIELVKIDFPPEYKEIEHKIAHYTFDGGKLYRS
jgi:hypothetical protein